MTYSDCQTQKESTYFLGRMTYALPACKANSAGVSLASEIEHSFRFN